MFPCGFFLHKFATPHCHRDFTVSSVWNKMSLCTQPPPIYEPHSRFNLGVCHVRGLILIIFIFRNSNTVTFYLLKAFSLWWKKGTARPRALLPTECGDLWKNQITSNQLFTKYRLNPLGTLPVVSNAFAHTVLCFLLCFHFGGATSCLYQTVELCMGGKLRKCSGVFSAADFFVVGRTPYFFKPAWGKRNLKNHPVLVFFWARAFSSSWF